MDSMRKTALWAGALYLLTFVSIPTLALYGPVKEPGYIAGPGPDTGTLVGGILELIVGLACIGTAVGVVPGSQAAERGDRDRLLVAHRILEAATIFIGVAQPLDDRHLAPEQSRGEGRPSAHGRGARGVL